MSQNIKGFSQEFADIGKSTKISIWLLVIAIAIILIVYITCCFSYPITPEGFSFFGGYIGGVLSPLVAAMALYGLWKTATVQAKFLMFQIKDAQERDDEANKKTEEIAQRELFFRAYDAYLSILNQTKHTFKLVGVTSAGVNRNTCVGKELLDVRLDGLDGRGSTSSRAEDLNRRKYDDSVCEAESYDKYSKKALLNIYLENKGKVDESTIALYFQNDLMNNWLSFLEAYFRFVHKILKQQSSYPSNNLLKYENISFFRAQLTEAELIFISLNILFTDEGRSGLSPYIKEFGLLKHLKSHNIRRIVKIEFGEECFGRSYAAKTHA